MRFFIIDLMEKNTHTLTKISPMRFLIINHPNEILYYRFDEEKTPTLTEIYQSQSWSILKTISKVLPESRHPDEIPQNPLYDRLKINTL